VPNRGMQEKEARTWTCFQRIGDMIFGRGADPSEVIMTTQLAKEVGWGICPISSVRGCGGSKFQ